MAGARKRLVIAASAVIASTSALVGALSLFVPLSSVVVFFTQPYAGPMDPRPVDLALKALSLRIYDTLWTIRNEDFPGARWIHPTVVLLGLLGACVASVIFSARARRALRNRRVDSVHRFLRGAAQPLGDGRAPDELVRLAREGTSADVRIEALRALCERHAETTHCSMAVQDAAFDASPRVRLFAVGHLRDAATTRTVLETLAFAGDEGVAAVSIQRLARASEAEAEPLLLRVLRSTDGVARVAAVRALGEVGGRESLAPLRLQKNRIATLTDQQLLKAAEAAIAKIETRLGKSAPVAGAVSLPDVTAEGALSEAPQTGALSLPNSAAGRRSGAGTG